MPTTQNPEVTECAMVQTNSEIPLPSPSFYSLSCLGTVAIWISTIPFLGGPWLFPASCEKPRLRPVATLDVQSNQKPRDIDQLGSLAGAARLLQDNAGVLKHCSDGTEISQGGEGQRCC